MMMDRRDRDVADRTLSAPYRLLLLLFVFYCVPFVARNAPYPTSLEVYREPVPTSSNLISSRSDSHIWLINMSSHASSGQKHSYTRWIDKYNNTMLSVSLQGESANINQTTFLDSCSNTSYIKEGWHLTKIADMFSLGSERPEHFAGCLNNSYSKKMNLSNPQNFDFLYVVNVTADGFQIFYDNKLQAKFLHQFPWEDFVEVRSSSLGEGVAIQDKTDALSTYTRNDVLSLLATGATEKNGGTARVRYLITELFMILIKALVGAILICFRYVYFLGVPKIVFMYCADIFVLSLYGLSWQWFSVPFDVIKAGTYLMLPILSRVVFKAVAYFFVMFCIANFVEDKIYIFMAWNQYNRNNLLVISYSIVSTCLLTTDLTLPGYVSHLMHWLLVVYIVKLPIHLLSNISDGFAISVKWVFGYELNPPTFSEILGAIKIYYFELFVIFIVAYCFKLVDEYRKRAPARRQVDIDAFVEAGCSCDIETVRRFASKTDFNVNGISVGSATGSVHARNSTCLYAACVCGHVEIVEFLLQTVPIDQLTSLTTSCSDLDLTPLCGAVHYNRIDIVKLFIRCKLDLKNTTNPEGISSIEVAIGRGFFKLAKLLIVDDASRDRAFECWVKASEVNFDYEKAKSIFNIFDDQYLYDKFVQAAYLGRKVALSNIYNLFRIYNATIPSHMAKRSPILAKHSEGGTLLCGISCLLAACMNCDDGNFDALNYLLSCNESKDIFQDTNNLGRSALMIAIENKNLEMVKTLFAHGFDEYFVDSEGLTPLILAKHVGFDELVAILTGQEEIDDLVKAGWNGNLIEVKELLGRCKNGRYFVDINGQHSGKGKNLISFINVQGKAVLEHDMDLFGETCLSAACKRGNLEVVKFFLCSLRDATEKRSEGFEYLQDRVVNVNAINIYSEGGYSTPLINAIRAHSNAVEIVQELIETRKVDVFYVDQLKKSALSWARELHIEGYKPTATIFTKWLGGGGASSSIFELLNAYTKDDMHTSSFNYQYSKSEVRVGYDLEARIELAFMGPAVELPSDYPKLWTNSYNNICKASLVGGSVEKNSATYKGVIHYKHIDESGPGRPVAVKLLNNSGDLKELEREIKVLSSCRETPYLIRLIGFTRILPSEPTALVFEYASRGDLRSLLNQDSKEAIIWKQRIRIAQGIAKGINYLHDKKIFHRAIKSGNIVLTDDFTPKIIGFGVSNGILDNFMPCKSAKSMVAVADDIDGQIDAPSPRAEIIAKLPTSEDLKSLKILHCPEYLASPDMVYDEQCEIYSFGVILVELLTGMQPWDFAWIANYHEADTKFSLLEVQKTLQDEFAADKKGGSTSLDLYKSLMKRCIAKRAKQSSKIVVGWFGGRSNSAAGGGSSAYEWAETRFVKMTDVVIRLVEAGAKQTSTATSPTSAASATISTSEIASLEGVPGTNPLPVVDPSTSTTASSSQLLCTHCKVSISDSEPIRCNPHQLLNNSSVPPVHHYICLTCFKSTFVKNFSSRQFARQGLHIVCNICQDNGIYSPFDDEIISGKLNRTVRDLFFKARDEAVANFEKSKKHAAIIENKNSIESTKLKNRLERKVKELDSKKIRSAIIAYHRKVIQNKFLVTRCPHCELPFEDFVDDRGKVASLSSIRCFAVECRLRGVEDHSISAYEASDIEQNLEDISSTKQGAKGGKGFDDEDELVDKVSVSTKLLTTVGCGKYFCGYCIEKFNDYLSCSAHVKVCPLNSWNRGVDSGLPHDFDRVRVVTRERGIVEYFLALMKKKDETLLPGNNLEGNNRQINPIDDDEDDNSIWICKFCTFRHKNLNANICEVCDNPRDRLPIAPKKTKTAAPAKSNHADLNKKPNATTRSIAMMDTIIDVMRAEFSKFHIDGDRLKFMIQRDISEL